eukprot:TRINITY_DN4406_c0_g1_i11.p1 TRINITY_DN4406_c0_g1~~TRINITY_DN4406_c0_g1_i11.p1  ORF type:complete len:226 (+),score=-6.34 TRINITY_DN4406_c0_g1_i11:682-1359(+)
MVTSGGCIYNIEIYMGGQQRMQQQQQQQYKENQKKKKKKNNNNIFFFFSRKKRQKISRNGTGGKAGALPIFFFFFFFFARPSKKFYNFLPPTTFNLHFSIFPSQSKIYTGFIQYSHSLNVWLEIFTYYYFQQTQLPSSFQKLFRSQLIGFLLESLYKIGNLIRLIGCKIVQLRLLFGNLKFLRVLGIIRQYVETIAYLHSVFNILQIFSLGVQMLTCRQLSVKHI